MPATKNTTQHAPFHEDGMVTTLMIGLKKKQNGHIRKNLHPKVVNPRDIAGERKKKKKIISRVLLCVFEGAYALRPVPSGV